MRRSRPRPRLALAGALLLSLLCATAALAQDAAAEPAPSDLESMDLEQLTNLKVEKVYGVSKFEQVVTEAPASVTVITSDEIRRYGWRTMADVLNATRGFFTTYDRNYSYIGTRGFNRPGDYNTRLLLLVDGHRINDAIYESAAIGTEFILDMALIDRIEIIRGPSSSLYGAGAFFGVINVISKSAKQIDGVEVGGGWGSQQTGSGRITYGKLFNGGELVVSGSGYSSRGNDRLFFPAFNDPATNNGIASNMDRERSYSLFLSGHLQDLTLTGALVSRDKRVPTASFGTIFNDPRTNSNDRRSFLDLRYDKAIDGTGVTARLFYDEYRFTGNFAYDKTGDDPVFYPATYVNRDDHLARWWGAELQASRQLLPRLQLTGGMMFRDNFQIDLPNYDLVPGGRRLDNSHDNLFYALFGQAELRILETLILNAGIRYDHYETFGGATSPRLALIYTPVEGTVFKLVYGQAFRAPNAYELYYNDVFNGYATSPTLRPETVRSYEAIYEQYYGDVVRTSASLFYNQIDHLISYQDVSPTQVAFANVERVKAVGGEFEIEGQWNSGFAARSSYGFVAARDRETDHSLDYSPRHLVKLNLTAPLYLKKVFAGIELQGVSRREFTHNGAQVASPGYLVTNATLSSTALLPGLEASFSIYNLLDRRLQDPATTDHVQSLIPQDGRTYRFLFSYRF
ncbi:TonB-dependent receptor plug domain-containing protein [Geomonas anaerohicana]|uniref:TonB-dependent receptor n=1 Tax=Geomonas anaerohicana TaxID=2798583 RepID=A0ABS0Y8W9_9BACT|nr:TonB-dependent receptor [Geomonas anaerohicana]MBJ6748743.1 TonB-dependent receptor [Geomonas anaerohicana]